MIVINSGAFVIPEFQAEIGKLPPCLLPVANKKLIEHQVKVLNKYFNEDIYVSLPDSYEVSDDEEALFKDLGVKVIITNTDYTLSEAVLFLLNISNLESEETIRLLHGDTLITEYPVHIADCLGLGNTSYNYMWETEGKVDYEQSPSVWCGYFSFSDKSLLMKSLALSRGNFVTAVRDYSNQKPLTGYHFNGWYDFGHINTYFRSRAKLTTERVFNSLEIKDNLLAKTGYPPKKIEAEALWFKNIPTKLKVFTPQLISYDISELNSSYVIEYLSLMPLNELFVHGKKPAKSWGFIFEKIFDYLDTASNFDISSSQLECIEYDFEGLILNKSISRIKKYSLDNNFDLDRPLSCNGINSPSIAAIIDTCIKDVLSLKSLPGIIHGDLCLSNILFDSRSNQIKLIDPRGLNFNDEPTIWGDQRYDLAKLAHSVIGLYDLIISDRFRYVESNNYNFSLSFNITQEIGKVQDELLKTNFKGIEIIDVYPLIILLFISMLPLHNDRKDRQKAMLANAVRLYNEYVKA